MHWRTKAIIAEAETWHYLKDNKWLFATNTPSRITIDCWNETTYQQTLPNRGILSLPASCTAASQEYIFYPHSNIVSGKPTEYKEMPRFNFSEEGINPVGFTPIIVPKVEAFNPQHIHQLYNLQQEELLHFESEQLAQKHPWFTWSNLAYTTIALVLIGYVYWRLRPRKNEQPNQHLAIGFNLPPVREQVQQVFAENIQLQPMDQFNRYQNEHQPRRSRRINPHNE